MERNFKNLLEARWAEGKHVCVGLDSDLSKIPDCITGSSFVRMIAFNKAIIDATSKYVCAYKPNLAFYLQHDSLGIQLLIQTVSYIHIVAPDVPVILDAKFADLGNTNRGYAVFAFDQVGADAVTLHPYFGKEALAPFLEREDKGAIVLCRTSNSGAPEFQNTEVGADGEMLYQRVARNVSRSWNERGNCALVVGATYPRELETVRGIVGDDMPILIPGIGAQGGDLEATVLAGRNARGNGMIINSSRGIIFASNGEDFASAAQRELKNLSEQIRTILKGVSA